VAPSVQQIGSICIGWQPLNDTSTPKDLGDMPGGKRCFDALKAGGQTFNGSTRRAAFAGALVGHGRPAQTPVAVVSEGSTPNQRAVGNALEAAYATTLTGPAATLYTNLLMTGTPCFRSKRSLNRRPSCSESLVRWSRKR